MDQQVDYEALFQRNLGVLEPGEQEMLRQAKVLVLGCGGIGGVVAMGLARSGVGSLELIDPEVFGPENMNRQVMCFSETVGENKALATKEAILRINPHAAVNTHQRVLSLSEVEDLLPNVDVVFPAADDWAYSFVIFRMAQRLGTPAVMAYPVGALGRACVFMPESPTIEECLCIPHGLPYDDLREFMEDPRNRRVLEYYKLEGAWRESWFDQWCQGDLPHAQICTIVWLTATLAAQEGFKLITGKWDPVVAPHHWCVTPSTARVQKFGLFRRLFSRISRRDWARDQLCRLSRREWLLRLFTRLIR